MLKPEQIMSLNLLMRMILKEP